jgi:Domain of unknown function (DUF6430)
VDERQNLSDHEALGFAVWQHCPIAKTEITEKKLLYLFDLLKPNENWFQQWLINHYLLVVLLISVFALVIACVTLIPKIRVSSKIKQRDMTISIEIGDVFDTSDVLVIGTNRTFDTSLENELISLRSIQGQFTKLYYSSVTHLDAELDAQLRNESFEQLNQSDKSIGKLKCYEYGTVARVNSSKRTTYFLAMVTMNTHGVATCSIEDLRASLSGLWQHISEKGGGLPNLRIPVLGTGFGKLIHPRQSVIKEILRSLVAASSSDRFCDQCSIVISVSDYLNHQIDLDELGDFLKYLTTYTEFRSTQELGGGVPVG